MLNHITLQGRLTKDPELRYTRSNTPVASFTVAVERDIAPQGQDRQTDFINCVAWKSRGEFISTYFHKGDMIVVSGRLQIREWVDRDNKTQKSAEVVVDNAYFGGQKREKTEKRYNDIPADATFGGFEDLGEYDGELPY